MLIRVDRRMTVLAEIDAYFRIFLSISANFIQFYLISLVLVFFIFSVVFLNRYQTIPKTVYKPEWARIETDWNRLARTETNLKRNSRHE